MVVTSKVENTGVAKVIKEKSLALNKNKEQIQNKLYFFHFSTLTAKLE